MVNIINELEQRNKNLLEENEVLKKQLADVVPNTAGEQIVFDTWDLASIDRA